MNDKSKMIIAWILLIFAIIASLVLSYLKFFAYAENPNIEEVPVENSTALAINNALKEIVNYFNGSEEVQSYMEESVGLRATLNQYSIFINYTLDDETVTYEFTYSNLLLGITIENEEENIQRFHTVYAILMKAVQMRLGNTENIDTVITEFLENDAEIEGLYRETKENTIYYEMDITKKITLPTE